MSVPIYIYSPQIYFCNLWAFLKGSSRSAFFFALLWLFNTSEVSSFSGVALTHYNMVANIWQFAVHNPMFGLNPGNTILAVLPMYHIYGLYVFALAAPMRGANVVLLPEFNPVTFLTSIQKYRASHVYIVPPLALFLIKDPRVKEYDLTSIRVSL